VLLTPVQLAQDDPPLPWLMGDQRILNPRICVGASIEKVVDGARARDAAAGLAAGGDAVGAVAAALGWGCCCCCDGAAAAAARLAGWPAGRHVLALVEVVHADPLPHTSPPPPPPSLLPLPSPPAQATPHCWWC
jgi:hypothetical protein